VVGSVYCDPYQTLQVSPLASASEIRAAYRCLAREFHPDVNTSPRAKHHMQAINWAYAVLCDPAMKAAYDLRHSQRQSHSKQKHTRTTTRPKTSQPETYASPPDPAYQPRQDPFYSYKRYRKDYAPPVWETREPVYSGRDVFGGFILLVIFIMVVRLIGVGMDPSNDVTPYQAAVSNQLEEFQRESDDRLQLAIDDYYLQQYYDQREAEMRDSRWNLADDSDPYENVSKYDNYASPYDDYEGN